MLLARTWWLKIYGQVAQLAQDNRIRRIFIPKEIENKIQFLIGVLITLENQTNFQPLFRDVSIGESVGLHV